MSPVAAHSIREMMGELPKVLDPPVLTELGRSTSGQRNLFASHSDSSSNRVGDGEVSVQL
jgi:hypothetical protein